MCFIKFSIYFITSSMLEILSSLSFILLVRLASEVSAQVPNFFISRFPSVYVSVSKGHWLVMWIYTRVSGAILLINVSCILLFIESCHFCYYNYYLRLGTIYSLFCLTKSHPEVALLCLLNLGLLIQPDLNYGISELPSNGVYVLFY